MDLTDSLRQTSTELWQGQQRTVFVEAGAATFFPIKFPLQNSWGWGGGQCWWDGGHPAHGGPTEGLLHLHPPASPGMQEGGGPLWILAGDAAWHFLTVSFFSLFFSPWYQLLGLDF